MKISLYSVAALTAVLAGCATYEPRPAVPAAPPVNLARVYFYPGQGQSEEQQDRDRYECHTWSVRETKFDPSKHVVTGAERGTVVPARSSGQTIGAAAAVGAVLGAVVAGQGDVAKGAVVGAMAGTVVGSAAASANEADARRAQQYRTSRMSPRYEKQAGEFRRAMSACLEGRGYSVK